MVNININKYCDIDVSIIIVNYNTKKLLSQCISSIVKMTKDISYEIIVVDNASKDGSVDMLKKNYSNVRVIEAGSNLGFGRANNLGMENAYGKYYLLLNSDTLLLNNAIKIFYDKAQALKRRNLKFGGLGAILIGSDMQTCNSFGRFATPILQLRWELSKYFRFLKDRSINHPDKVSDTINVDYITGADLLIPKEVYEITRGFDPDFFMYCEEVDLQKRMENLGLSRLIIPGPEIIHLEGGSDDSQKKVWSVTRLKYLYKSKRLYFKKHFNKQKYPLFRVAYCIIVFPSIIISSIINMEISRIKLVKYL